MGRKPTDKQQQDFIEYLRQGRDEMNLLEHSISSAGAKVDRETRSLLFSRTDVDPESKQPVERSWEVSFSKFGRPTAIDDDVFVALLKVSSDLGFSTKRVEFTRYELCKILGWSDCGKSYKAIDDALRRITGVYIVATNFWYDNRAKGWRDRNFHVIDTSEVFSRERFDQERRALGGETPKSWFQWSDTMLESFAAGYLRKLDINEYLSLENPVARKLYRYLGMQFYYRTRLCIDLGVLCCEKLGYRRGTEPNELRRKVLPAISQLEGRGIYGLSHEFNATYGKCEVIFNAKATTKDSGKADRKQSPATNPLIERLANLGVDRATAAEAVKRLDAERITIDIEHVEYEAKAGRVKASKAGMLATMLKSAEPWPRPQGFVSSSERDQRKQLAAAKEAQRRQAEAAEEARLSEEESQKLAAFNSDMARLSAAELSELEERAKRAYWFGEKYRQALKAGDATQLAAARRDALYAVWSSDNDPRKKPTSSKPAVPKSHLFPIT